MVQHWACRYCDFECSGGQGEWEVGAHIQRVHPGYEVVCASREQCFHLQARTPAAPSSGVSNDTQRNAPSDVRPTSNELQIQITDVVSIKEEPASPPIGNDSVPQDDAASATVPVDSSDGGTPIPPQYNDRHSGSDSPTFECRLCGDQFTQQQDIFDHVKTEHFIGHAVLYRCLLCVFSSPDFAQIENHLSMLHDIGSNENKLTHVEEVNVGKFVDIIPPGPVTNTIPVSPGKSNSPSKKAGIQEYTNIKPKKRKYSDKKPSPRKGQVALTVPAYDDNDEPPTKKKVIRKKAWKERCHFDSCNVSSCTFDISISTFWSWEEMQMHKLIHHYLGMEKRIFKCGKCGFCSAFSKGMRFHARIGHVTDDTRCPMFFTDDYGKSWWLLPEQVQLRGLPNSDNYKSIPGNIQQWFQCKLCGRVSTLLGILYDVIHNHMNQREIAFSCSLCIFVSCDGEGIIEHLMTVHNKKRTDTSKQFLKHCGPEHLLRVLPSIDESYPRFLPNHQQEYALFMTIADWHRVRSKDDAKSNPVDQIKNDALSLELKRKPAKFTRTERPYSIGFKSPQGSADTISKTAEEDNKMDYETSANREKQSAAPIIYKTSEVLGPRHDCKYPGCTDRRLFLSKGDLSLHVFDTHFFGIRSTFYKCSECWHASTHPTGVRHHIRKHHFRGYVLLSVDYGQTFSKDITCKVRGCKFQCDSAWDLKVHHKLHQQQNHLRCTSCHKLFQADVPKLSALKKHQCSDGSNLYEISHDQGRSYELAEEYLSEMTAKQNSYKLKCTESGCSFQSSTRKELHSHKLQVHMSEFKFFSKCSLCHFSSIDSKDVVIHFRKSHSATSQVDVMVTEDYGKTFYRKNSHMPDCQIAGCHFSSPYNRNMSLHLQMHSNKRYVRCQKCHALFPVRKHHLFARHRCGTEELMVTTDGGDTFSPLSEYPDTKPDAGHEDEDEAETVINDDDIDSKSLAKTIVDDKERLAASSKRIVKLSCKERGCSFYTHVSRMALHEHKLRVHMMKYDVFYKCSNCCFSALQMRDVVSHISKTHCESKNSVVFVTYDCGKTFQTKSLAAPTCQVPGCHFATQIRKKFQRHSQLHCKRTFVQCLECFALFPLGRGSLYARHRCGQDRLVLTKDYGKTFKPYAFGKPTDITYDDQGNERSVSVPRSNDSDSGESGLENEEKPDTEENKTVDNLHGGLKDREVTFGAHIAVHNDDVTKTENKISEHLAESSINIPVEPTQLSVNKSSNSVEDSLLASVSQNLHKDELVSAQQSTVSNATVGIRLPVTPALLDNVLPDDGKGRPLDTEGVKMMLPDRSEEANLPVNVDIETTRTAVASPCYESKEDEEEKVCSEDKADAVVFGAQTDAQVKAPDNIVEEDMSIEEDIGTEKNESETTEKNTSDVSEFPPWGKETSKVQATAECADYVERTAEVPRDQLSHRELLIPSADVTEVITAQITKNAAVTDNRDTEDRIPKSVDHIKMATMSESDVKNNDIKSPFEDISSGSHAKSTEPTVVFPPESTISTSSIIDNSMTTELESQVISSPVKVDDVSVINSKHGAESEGVAQENNRLDLAGEKHMNIEVTNTLTVPHVKPITDIEMIREDASICDKKDLFRQNVTVVHEVNLDKTDEVMKAVSDQVQDGVEKLAGEAVSQMHTAKAGDQDSDIKRTPNITVDDLDSKGVSSHFENRHIDTQDRVSNVDKRGVVSTTEKCKDVEKPGIDRENDSVTKTGDFNPSQEKRLVAELSVGDEDTCRETEDQGEHAGEVGIMECVAADSPPEEDDMISENEIALTSDVVQPGECHMEVSAVVNTNDIFTESEIKMTTSSSEGERVSLTLEKSNIIKERESPLDSSTVQKEDSGEHDKIEEASTVKIPPAECMFREDAQVETAEKAIILQTMVPDMPLNISQTVKENTTIVAHPTLIIPRDETVNLAKIQENREDNSNIRVEDVVREVENQRVAAPDEENITLPATEAIDMTDDDRLVTSPQAECMEMDINPVECLPCEKSLISGRTETIPIMIAELKSEVMLQAGGERVSENEQPVPSTAVAVPFKKTNNLKDTNVPNPATKVEVMITAEDQGLNVTEDQNVTFPAVIEEHDKTKEEGSEKCKTVEYMITEGKHVLINDSPCTKTIPVSSEDKPLVELQREIVQKEVTDAGPISNVDEVVNVDYTEVTDVNPASSAEMVNEATDDIHTTSVEDMVIDIENKEFATANEEAGIFPGEEIREEKERNSEAECAVNEDKAVSPDAEHVQHTEATVAFPTTSVEDLAIDVENKELTANEDTGIFPGEEKTEEKERSLEAECAVSEVQTVLPVAELVGDTEATDVVPTTSVEDMVVDIENKEFTAANEDTGICPGEENRVEKERISEAECAVNEDKAVSPDAEPVRYTEVTDVIPTTIAEDMAIDVENKEFTTANEETGIFPGEENRVEKERSLEAECAVSEVQAVSPDAEPVRYTEATDVIPTTIAEDMVVDIENKKLTAANEEAGIFPGEEVREEKERISEAECAVNEDKAVSPDAEPVRYTEATDVIPTTIAEDMAIDVENKEFTTANEETGIFPGEENRVEKERSLEAECAVSEVQAVSPDAEPVQHNEATVAFPTTNVEDMAIDIENKEFTTGNEETGIFPGEENGIEKESLEAECAVSEVQAVSPIRVGDTEATDVIPTTSVEDMVVDIENKEFTAANEETGIFPGEEVREEKERSSKAECAVSEVQAVSPIRVGDTEATDVIPTTSVEDMVVDIENKEFTAANEETGIFPGEEVREEKERSSKAECAVSEVQAVSPIRVGDTEATDVIPTTSVEDMVVDIENKEFTAANEDTGIFPGEENREEKERSSEAECAVNEDQAVSQDTEPVGLDSQAATVTPMTTTARPVKSPQPPEDDNSVQEGIDRETERTMVVTRTEIEAEEDRGISFDEEMQEIDTPSVTEPDLASDNTVTSALTEMEVVSEVVKRSPVSVIVSDDVDVGNDRQDVTADVDRKIIVRDNQRKTIESSGQKSDSSTPDILSVSVVEKIKSENDFSKCREMPQAAGAALVDIAMVEETENVMNRGLSDVASPPFQKEERATASNVVGGVDVSSTVSQPYQAPAVEMIDVSKTETDNKSVVSTNKESGLTQKNETEVEYVNMATESGVISAADDDDRIVTESGVIFEGTEASVTFSEEKRLTSSLSADNPDDVIVRQTRIEAPLGVAETDPNSVTSSDLDSVTSSIATGKDTISALEEEGKAEASENEVQRENLATETRASSELVNSTATDINISGSFPFQADGHSLSTAGPLDHIIVAPPQLYDSGASGSVTLAMETEGNNSGESEDFVGMSGIPELPTTENNICLRGDHEVEQVENISLSSDMVTADREISDEDQGVTSSVSPSGEYLTSILEKTLVRLNSATGDMPDTSSPLSYPVGSPSNSVSESASPVLKKTIQMVEICGTMEKMDTDDKIETVTPDMSLQVLENESREDCNTAVFSARTGVTDRPEEETTMDDSDIEAVSLVEKSPPFSRTESCTPVDSTDNKHSGQTVQRMDTEIDSNMLAAAPQITSTQPVAYNIFDGEDRRAEGIRLASPKNSKAVQQVECASPLTVSGVVTSTCVQMNTEIKKGTNEGGFATASTQVTALDQAENPPDQGTIAGSNSMTSCRISSEESDGQTPVGRFPYIPEEALGSAERIADEKGDNVLISSTTDEPYSIGQETLADADTSPIVEQTSMFICGSQNQETLLVQRSATGMETEHESKFVSDNADCIDTPSCSTAEQHVAESIEPTVSENRLVSAGQGGVGFDNRVVVESVNSPRSPDVVCNIAASEPTNEEGQPALNISIFSQTGDPSKRDTHGD